MAGYKYDYVCPMCYTHLVFKMRVTQTQRKCPQCGRKVTPEEIDRQQETRDSMNQVREAHASNMMVVSAVIAFIIAFLIHIQTSLITVIMMAFFYWIPLAIVLSIVVPLFSNVEKKVTEVAKKTYLGKDDITTSLCPFCSSQIFDFTIKPGDNTCPHCKGHFSIDE